jgi:hypothetical protein
MNELDSFLVKAIVLAIKNEMDAEKIKNLEQKLEHEHGVKFSDIFHKFEQVKSSLFEFESQLIEDNTIRDFLVVEADATTLEKWLVVKNKHLTERILKTFADADKKLILDLTRENPETIPKILVLCNLPNTSGYRKMNQLIEEGFVIPVGLAETFEGKRAIIYRSIIQKIQISISKDVIITKVLVPKETLASSQIVKVISGTHERTNTHTN